MNKFELVDCNKFLKLFLKNHKIGYSFEEINKFLAESVVKLENVKLMKEVNK